jgi:hypothetical protein
MVGVYFRTRRLPVQYLIYIAITAATLPSGHRCAHGVGCLSILYLLMSIAGAIGVLSLAILVLSIHRKTVWLPRGRGDASRHSSMFPIRGQPMSHSRRESSLKTLLRIAATTVVLVLSLMWMEGAFKAKALPGLAEVQAAAEPPPSGQTARVERRAQRRAALLARPRSRRSR